MKVEMLLRLLFYSSNGASSRKSLLLGPPSLFIIPNRATLYNYISNIVRLRSGLEVQRSDALRYMKLPSWVERDDSPTTSGFHPSTSSASSYTLVIA